MSGYPGFSGIRIGIMHRHLEVHSSFRVRTDLGCALSGGAEISGTRSFCAAYLRCRPRHVPRTSGVGHYQPAGVPDLGLRKGAYMFGVPPRPPVFEVHSVESAKNLVRFSICACHPCAGAMLIFSVSFQFLRMIPEGYPSVIATHRH
jgi:hypothetical protein